jgi:hypothetical protein
MRKSKRLWIIVLLVLSVGMSSCSSDDRTNDDPDKILLWGDGTTYFYAPYVEVTTNSLPSWLRQLIIEKDDIDIVATGTKNQSDLQNEIYLIHSIYDATLIGYFYDVEGNLITLKEETDLISYMKEWNWTCIYYKK